MGITDFLKKMFDKLNNKSVRAYAVFFASVLLFMIALYLISFLTFSMAR